MSYNYLQLVVSNHYNKITLTLTYDEQSISDKKKREWPYLGLARASRSEVQNPIGWAYL